MTAYTRFFEDVHDSIEKREWIVKQVMGLKEAVKFCKERILQEQNSVVAYENEIKRLTMVLYPGVQERSANGTP